MKSYDYNAVTCDGGIYCIECIDHPECEECFPIFADSEWDYIPTCSVCQQEHDYVSILPQK